MVYFLLLTLLLILLAQHIESQPQHAINAHKAPKPTTPQALTQSWHVKDTKLHAYISEHVPDVLEHTGSEAFDAHLMGVQGLLRGWGAEEWVTDAGLFHSICEFEVA